MTVATAPANATRALTIVDRVEQSPAIAMLDSRAQALVDLLPDASAATRFRRVVIQALVKNPDLLECTPDSVVLSVFEAAAQGLEPTGASGGAHLVPFNVKVSRNPERWEKRAQLIPDYRGVIHLLTKPNEMKGRLVPSEVSAIEARVVKEGDEFRYTEGSDAQVHHVPSLAAGRSAKPTTHVYVIARLRNGERIPTVMDHAGIEHIRNKRKGDAFSPWATDWDEMAKKTVIKRAAKTLPVHPDVRSILMREDDADDGPAVVEPTVSAPRKVDRLAARLATTPVATVAVHDDVEDPSEPGHAETEPETVDGSFIEAPAAEPAEKTPSAGQQLRSLILDTADANAGDAAASTAAVNDILGTTFKGWNQDLVQEGIAAIFGAASVAKPRAHEVTAIKAAAASMSPVAFLAAWREIAAMGVAE